jgi:putative two-component system protein, hydrogenase maturation factor HypX/HoxX
VWATETFELRMAPQRQHPPSRGDGRGDRLHGLEVYLYGVHEESLYRGKAGSIVAQRDGAVCFATTDRAIWVSKLQERGPKNQRGLRLPAARVYLHFDFHNGAMSTGQCQRLQRAFQLAKTRPTKVIALVGGEDFHSNGIHLGVIEAANDPAAESWRNINAINDLVLEVLTCTTHLTVSAVRGNAGAGGAVLALACDYVCARSGRIFNLHYKTMGLRGSEYWTYLLPMRVGTQAAHRLTASCLPISAENAFEIGLVDELIDERGAAFMARLATYLDGLCEPTKLPGLLQSKREALPPAAVLQQYRLDELAQMRMDFEGPAYDAAREAFCVQGNPNRNPSPLAPHRRRERADVHHFI